MKKSYIIMKIKKELKENNCKISIFNNRTIKKKNYYYYYFNK